MNTDTLTTVGQGVAGAATSHLVTQLAANDTSSAQGIIGIIVQAIIGVVTLFHLFKKKKTDTGS